MRLKYKLLSVFGLLLSVFFLGRCGRTSPHQPSVLPKGDTEQIMVNPGSHTLTILTPSGPKVMTLPDRPSIFDIKTDGTVKVTSKQLGFEHHMFMGYVVSDSGRLATGVDLGYCKQLDLGIGLADQFGAHTPIGFAKLTFNILGSVQVGLIYGTNQSIGGILSVRLF